MIQHFHVRVSHRQYYRHMTHLFEQRMPQVYSKMICKTANEHHIFHKEQAI